MSMRKTSPKKPVGANAAGAAGRPSALLDTRVICFGDKLEQLGTEKVSG